MVKSPKLSIVIGSYHNKDLTINTIKSIYKYSIGVDFEIIVIDDASNDGIYEYIENNFPNIVLRRNYKNLSYSKTYNRGSKLARGKYILHLNADSVFTKKTNLLEVIKYMDENPSVGMLGNRVLSPNGKLDPDNRHQIPTLANAIGQSLGLYKIFPSIKSLNYYMTYLRNDEFAEVGGVGAFMLFRKEVLKDVGLLDTNFKIYCQDSDFCYRVAKSGWKIIYYPNSTVIHFGAGSFKRFRIKTQIIFHEDLWRFYKKHLITLYPQIVKYVIFIGLFFRFFIFLFLEIYLEFESRFRNEKLN